MSEHCRRAATISLWAADEDATPEDAGWLEEHLEACDACRSAYARLVALDQKLADYEPALRRCGTAVEANRAHILAVAEARRPPSSGMQFVPALLAAAAAMMFLAWSLMRHPAPGLDTPTAGATVITPEDQQFVPIPFVPPLAPYETARVMRVDVPVASLIAAGYRIPGADPAAVLPADVLVGEDGRTHAVRLLSGQSLNGWR